MKVDELQGRATGTFWRDALRNSHAFGTVLDKDGMEALVLGKGLANQVGNVSDRVGLKNLSGEIGPFLVVEPYIEYSGMYQYVLTLQVIDPAIGAVVLEIRHAGRNLAGIDGPVIRPVLNGLVDWAAGRPIAQEPP